MPGSRSTKPIRLLVATLVLVGNIGSSPAYSHTHARPGSSHDAHLEHSGHDHADDDSGLEHDLDHNDAVRVDDSASHLHGAWLGIPFSLSNPPGQEGSRSGLLSFSEACLTATTDADADHFGLKLPLGPRVWGIPYSHCAHRGPSAPSILAIPSSYGASSPSALLTRSVVLRC